MLMSHVYAATQVNGEPQKRAQEISAEVAVALTLSELHPEAGGLSCCHPKIECLSIHHHSPSPSITITMSHFAGLMWDPIRQG